MASERTEHPNAGRALRAEEVVAFVDATWQRPCARCREPLLGQEAVLSLLLGFGDGPCCAGCLARAHGAEPLELLERGARNVRSLACYRAGWVHADRRLAACGPWPGARIPQRLRMDGEDFDDEDDDEDDDGRDAAVPPVADEAALPPEFAAAQLRYDAGDKGCGELVLDLKVHLGGLPAGALVHLVATDLGAREDLPAWCRLTGHRLLHAVPPHYLVARRPDPTPRPS